MAKKVKPIKVKRMFVRDIPPGEFFSMNGTGYIMINPYNSYNEFASDVFVIINNECLRTMILGDSVAFVRAVVAPRKKGDV